MTRIILLVLAVIGSSFGQTAAKNTTLKNTTASASTNSFVGPWISNINVTPSTTSAVVTWKTDIASSSQVGYGINPAYGTTTTLDPTLVTSHSVSISGLSVCSTYHFRAISVDGSSHSNSSSDQTIYTKGCDTIANPVPATCYPYNPNEHIHIKSTSDISTVRQNAINAIWPVSHALPTRQPDTVNTNIGTTYTYLNTTGFTNLSNIDKLGIDTGPWHEEVILLKPTSSNGKLAVVHQGHCVSGGLANNLNDIGVGPMIKALSNAGFYVLAFQEPYCGNNTPTNADSVVAHNTLAGSNIESPTFNPLQIWAEPIVVGINYAVTNYGPFSQTAMVGISGGGWATVLISAIDTRISISFPVSGSFPNGLADETNTCTPSPLPEGDYEQGIRNDPNNGWLPMNFWLNVMSYEDAYIMASSQGHRQIQMLRQSDPCCWGGPRYGTYESTINNMALYLSGGGFSVNNDMTSTTHQIEPGQITTIMTTLGY